MRILVKLYHWGCWVKHYVFCYFFITNWYYKSLICFRIITPNICLIDFSIEIHFICPEIFFSPLMIKMKPAYRSCGSPLEVIFFVFYFSFFNRNPGKGVYMRPHFDKLRVNCHFSASFTTFLVYFTFIKSLSLDLQ